MKAQTIEIDSIFTSDGEIFPFSPNDTIYGLSITGSVVLHSDTSLVRVILTDDAGNEWMVYEAYPMIVTDTAFDIEEVCDETCFLEESIPLSLEIQIIYAEITIGHLSIQSNQYQNLTELQLQAKSIKDLEKNQYINEFISLMAWDWIADTTGFVKMFYFEKAQIFGNKYNLLGRDYYIGGIFYSALHEGIPRFTENTIISHFDWREKHNSHLLNSRYYGGESNETDNGWMTGIRNQGKCGTCGVFSAIATLEAGINLYANYQFDIDEQTEFSEKEAYNCSWWKGVDEDYTVGCGDCTTGKNISTIMDKLSEEGVVDESCLEYKNPLCEGSGPDCSFSEKCPDPSMTAQICDEKIFIMPYGYNQEERAAFLKEKLINNGPLSVNITNWPHRGVEHAVSLVGFDEVDGQIAWIYKNSHGIDFEINGYGKEPFWLGQSGGPVVNPTINATIHAINYDVSCPNPITVICYHDCVTPDFNYHVHDYDKDHDGYYNWGIGPRINDHPPCFVEEEDSNDDDNRIGPFKDDYSGMPVKPIMNVTAQVGSDNPVPITNHGFFLIHNNPEIITVVISNPGNAQLNLAALLPVSIIQEGAEFFRLLDEDPQPESTICMGNESSFGVLFDTSTPDGPCMAKIRIQLASCDSDIYDYFEFAIVYGECEFKEEIYAVADYESWEGYQLMFRDVYIQDGGTLEIFGSVAMHEESDIMVDAGGQLIINGGLITGGCTNLWHGIDVWGNLGQPQTLEYQGKVSVINGGCVEYAETAIETAICSAPGRCFPSGGIVSCIDAVFKDNIIDVNFYPFQNTHPVTHEILPNFSRFTRSLFKTTNDFYTLFNFEPIAHMFMDGVGGINLKGCIFGNYSTQTTENRGKGIESYNASYYIFDACIEDYFPCPGKQASRFENLEYGIRAFNSIGFYTLTVDSVDFIHNLRGIHMRLIDNATIIKNTFDISDPEELWFGEALIGLYLDEFTMGFQIEENIFDGPLTYSQTYGIHLLNTGIEQKEIYNNRFNKLGCGIMAVGENRHANEGDGLCIKCNDFYDCGTDIYVKPEEYDGQSIITENTGIAQMQGEDGEGDPTLPAGNHFSDVTSSNYINYQGCGKIDYSYHGAGTPPEFLIPDFEGDINIIQDNEAIYSKEISCPSHLDGSISLSVEKTNLINETGLIEAYKDTLNMIVDGGDTESLNFEVITSFPEEALVIRQDLINESPYLSDTVMISAIEKEDVLPGAMVRDILIQNPQAPKSIKIMNALNQRQDTLPDYMIAEIMQGFSTYGAKELLEQELGKHTIKRDQAWKNLNLFYKNDTANTGEAIDSLITVHQNENRLSTRYDLAFIFLDLADSIYTFNTLNEIPSEFELSTQESVNHDQCMELFNVLWDIKNDSTGIDSLLIESLIDLAAADNTLYGIYANNLLIREKLLTYYEPVYMVEPFKSNPVLNQIPKLEIIKENLKLFPNPTTKYFIVQYDLTKQSSPGMLIMSDIKGKELKTMYLQDKLNQIVVPVVNYKGGIYVIRLFGGSELVDTKKITILH